MKLNTEGQVLSLFDSAGVGAMRSGLRVWANGPEISDFASNALSNLHDALRQTPKTSRCCNLRT